MSDPSVVAIVLAGGASRRFGGDKLGVMVDGRPLLHHALAAAATVAALRIAVVAPGDDRALPPGVERVHDPDPHEGPLAGLAAGLAAVPAGPSIAIVLAGDAPGVRAPVLRLLIETVRAGAPAAVLHDGAGPRPLPAAYAIDRACAAIGPLLRGGERRSRALPAALGAAVIEPRHWRPHDPDGATLRDVDRPADLRDRS